MIDQPTTSRIEIDEGDVLVVYDDATGMPIVKGSTVVGNPTIGVGTLLSAPGGITHAESQFIFANRLSMAEEKAQTLRAYAALNDARRGVLVEMVFQMGIGGVRAFVNTLAAMERGDFAAAASGMRASLWARETPERADKLATIMETGIDA